METTLILFVCMTTTTLLYLGFVIWRETEHRKQINELTSKIMAKNYVEFATYRKEEAITPPTTNDDEKKGKQIYDPVLGKVF